METSPPGYYSRTFISQESAYFCQLGGGEFFFALFPQGSFLIRPSDGATVNVTSHVTSDAGLANVLGGGDF